MRWALLIGVPVLVGGLTVLVCARRSQAALEADGARLDADLRRLGQRTDTQLRAQAQRWGDEIRADYAVRVPAFVRAQVDPALNEIGITPRFLADMRSITARYS